MEAFKTLSFFKRFGNKGIQSEIIFDLINSTLKYKIFKEHYQESSGVEKCKKFWPSMEVQGVREILQCF
jgi:hypothetical protein